MKARINVQIIEQNKKPAFAVIPYDEYLKLLSEDEVTVPHEVVGLVIKNQMTLLKAWRTYLGLSQEEVARKAGITQSALYQMEKLDNKKRSATLEKLAKALSLFIEQLQD